MIPAQETIDDNHGTPCACVAAASGIKASGVAPEAMLMPIRLRSGLGSMSEATAFKWAVDHGADIISCSWGPDDGDWATRLTLYTWLNGCGQYAAGH